MAQLQVLSLSLWEHSISVVARYMEVRQVPLSVQSTATAYKICFAVICYSSSSCRNVKRGRRGSGNGEGRINRFVLETIEHRSNFGPDNYFFIL